MSRLHKIGHLLAAVVAGSVLSAQAIEVPGDFDTIQDALDAAPSGAVVVVHGGVWDSITIRKPVTLLGDPAPLLEGADFGRQSPISLEGTGSGAVVLSRIRTGSGVPDSPAPPVFPPAIGGGGFSELHVFDSEIFAVDRAGLPSGLSKGGSGIDVAVPLVVIERSRVQASRTDIDDSCTSRAPLPAPGINAPAIVVVLDSHVSGGDSGRWQFIDWPTPQDCDPSQCPPGTGGTGIVCDTLYHSGSVIEGGRGPRWSNCLSGGMGSFFCCENPPGLAFVGREIPLARDLEALVPPRLGASFQLQVRAPGPSAKLLASLGTSPPVFVHGSGFSFLVPRTTVSLGIFPSPGTISIDIPPLLPLLGRTVTFQSVDPARGLSRPVLGAIHLP